MKKKINNSKDELLKTRIKAQGMKLGALITNAKMPKKAKEELVSLLPMMDFEQIEKLIDILEAKYLDSQTSNVDKKYKKEISKLTNNFSREKDALNKKFAKQLDSFSKNIK